MTLAHESHPVSICHLDRPYPLGDVVDRVVEILAEMDRAQVVPDAARPGFARFVVKTFGKQARAIGFAGKKNEPDDQRRLRGDLIELVAEVGGDPQLLEGAAELLDAHMAWSERGDPTAPAPVSREMLGIVMQLGTASGDVTVYERILARAKATTDAEERRTEQGPALAEFFAKY